MSELVRSMLNTRSVLFKSLKHRGAYDISSLSGKGGDGAVAFHREKFKPNGPPSGGNGGQGGNVYIACDASVSSLVGIPKQIRAAKGSSGLGTFRHGKNAKDTIIRVPVGTVVKEVTDPERRAKTKEEALGDTLAGLDAGERERKLRDLRWVHYPMHADENEGSDFFKEAENALLREEKAAERERMQERRMYDDSSTLHLDLTAPTAEGSEGHLVARGGVGGFGNPHFLTLTNRSPKWATRGKEGEWITLELELKLLADIGLVGFPNAGKSTLLRALTRSQAEVAPYAFTTLNPQVGTVRVWEGGEFDGDGSNVIEDSWLKRKKDQEAMDAGLDPQNKFFTSRLGGEVYRFTIADNPGLIARASENVGLGHSFLRSIERSLALVYVVDLFGPAPWDQLRVLKNELETYKAGLSRRARMVIANKADKLNDSDEDAVNDAKAKLEKLKSFVETELSENGVRLDLVPVSGKFKVNLEAAVERMGRYVKEAREAEDSEVD
ncbi:GTPase of the mitochondrial inner membrane that associates with the large ribosomal subunit [Tulasnella sp. 427]|nr:GTPase of the mitochondrial inner membrane that associates with the large ribosomal subunit [Tulasnella sp. 427]